MCYCTLCTPYLPPPPPPQPNREENGMDPNRDFPYQQAPDQCMTTITVRTQLFHPPPPLPS